MHQFTESSLPPKKLAQGPVDILCVKVLPKKRSSKLVYYYKATEIKKGAEGETFDQDVTNLIKNSRPWPTFHRFIIRTCYDIMLT